MLLCGKGRRGVDRRLQSRIPPVLWRLWNGDWGKRALTVCVLMTSVYIASDALAQVQDSSADIVFTRTITKEDMQEKMPANPVPDLGERIESRLRSLVMTMTRNQNGSNRQLVNLANEVPVPDADRDMLMRAVARESTTDVAVDRDTRIRATLQAEGGKAALDQIQQNLPILEKVKQGLNFKFDLRRFFVGGSSGGGVREGRVRYGLLVKNIVPAGDGVKRASLGRSASTAMYDTHDAALRDELLYAGHADVEWTIGPMTEDSSRKLFTETVGASVARTERSAYLPGLRLPDPSFSAKLEPGSLAAYVTQRDDPNAKGARLVVSQDQDYYQFAYQANTRGKKLTAEHGVRVPVAGEMAIGRRFDDQFELIQTSAYNVLMDKRAPAVNLHYLHQEKRYKGDVKIARAGVQVGMAVEMVPGWKPGDPVAKTPGERYSMEFLSRF